MSEGDLREEAANPIWVLLAGGEEVRLWLVPDRARPWREELEEALDGVPEGARLIVAVPRPLARLALGLLAGSGRRRLGPAPRRVEAAIRTAGAEVEAVYGLWPSARSPRLAFPWFRLSMVYWLQTSGVLGGGGSRLWTRALARSLLFTPLALTLTPGVAYVVRAGGTTAP